MIVDVLGGRFPTDAAAFVVISTASAAAAATLGLGASPRKAEQHPSAGYDSGSGQLAARKGEAEAFHASRNKASSVTAVNNLRHSRQHIAQFPMCFSIISTMKSSFGA